MFTKLSCGCLPIILSAFALSGFAQEKKDERGGSCEDTKKQFAYFCEKQGNPNDIMVQTSIACDNAKRNMAAACEGKSEQDYKYEFRDKDPK
jgi:hypothetical protein